MCSCDTLSKALEKSNFAISILQSKLIFLPGGANFGIFETKKHNNPYWLCFDKVRRDLNSSVVWATTTEGEKTFQFGTVQ